MRRLIIALFAQCCAASRRILLLHGSSSSAGAFLNRGALNVLGAAATAYHDGGPHAWQFGGVEWDADINEATDYGAFWSQTLKTPQSLAAGDLAVALVEDELRAGGYQGVIGFSQGAMLASVVAARAALGEPGSYALEFAVLCSGAVPPPYAELMSRLEATPLSARAHKLPTLHCCSEADQVISAERSKQLAACFGAGDANGVSAETVVLLQHDAGHAIPPKAQCQSLIAWADSICPQGSKYA